MTVKHNLSINMDETIEEQDSINPVENEELEQENFESGEDETTQEQEPSVPKEQYDQVLARAKKAETLLKQKKSQPSSQSPAPSNASVEETVLRATGMSSSLVEKLKKVAQIQGTSLIDAQNDPLFVAVKEQYEKEEKKKGSSLPASRGSASVKPQKAFTSEGLTREEHMDMYKKSLSE